MSKRWVPLVGLAAVVTLGVGCGSQDGSEQAVGITQQQFAGLAKRVSEIELFLGGDTIPEVEYDPEKESLWDWGHRIKEAICALESHTSAPNSSLCPPGGGGGSGDPPPTPPFL